jgi:hypothetical protein
MNGQLQRLLDHLSARIYPRRQAEIDQLHQAALSWESVSRLPLVCVYPLPSDAPFHPYPHSQIFDDPEKMLYNELVYAFNTSIACRDRIDDDLPLTIRANFGTVLMASLFGGCVEQVEENPPWARPFRSLDAFRAALERDPLDFSQGWCPRVIDRYHYYRLALSGYPELAEMIHLVLPDLQGPLDTVELLRGSEIYADFCRNVELVDQALHTSARAQVGFAHHLLSCINDGPSGFSHQHATLIRGRILIRNDSALMISPKMYRQQVASYDEMVLSELGGGGIHSCGKCEHNIDEFFTLPSMRCLDLGQSKMNNVDAIHAKARQRKIGITRVCVSREELVTGSIMERFPTGVSLVYEAGSLADAQTVVSAYHRATERAKS